MTSSVSSGVTSSTASDEDPTGTTSTDGSAQTEYVNSMVFMNGANFTGMTVERNDTFEDGTYWYEDRTEDKMISIVNRCVPMEPAWMEEVLDPVEEIERIVHDTVSAEAYDFWGEAGGDQTSVKNGFPTYYGQWSIGGNEDTHRYDGIIVLTDHYAYLYYFSIPGDDYEEMADTFRDIMQRLQLEEVKE